MRILHINAGNLFGGIEVLIATLAKHRALCPEMEMELAVCFPGRVREEVLATGTPVHVLGPARLSRPWTVWRVRRELQRLLSRNSFAAVICHGTWAHAIFEPVIRRSGIASVAWLHDRPASPMTWVDRWATWSTPPDLTICNSEYTRAQIARLFPQGRTTCVYCAVSLTLPDDPAAARAAVRKRVGTAPETVVILQVGRWESHKGHLFHMQALRGLADLPGWECWQVGGAQRPEEQAYLDSVRREAETCGVADRVRFLGHEKDVGKLMTAADIYCQPNIRPEPFGITFIEAMLSGLPVVATSLGGPVEIIDESCGLLVAAGDSAALTQTLRQLTGDAELRAHLGRGGPERARFLTNPRDRLLQLAGVLGEVIRPAVPALL